MKDIMIDLETLGTRPGSAIVSIGAVEFDDEKLGAEFYCVVDIASEPHMKVEMETVKWWVAQSDAAAAVFSDKGAVPILTALVRFRDFYFRALEYAGQKVALWSNGANFDGVLLTEAYLRNDLPVPWKFYMERCYRTVKEMYPMIPFERTGQHHNALDDAKSQALHMIKIAQYRKAHEDEPVDV